MADDTQPHGNETADRLASLLRGEAGLPELSSDPANQQPHPLATSQRELLRASRHEANQPVSFVPPGIPVRRSGKRATVKKLANPKAPGRPGVMRRPSWGDEPAGSEHGSNADSNAGFNAGSSAGFNHGSSDARSARPPHEVDPSQLPPPKLRSGFRVAGGIENAHSPTELFSGQIRLPKKRRGRSSKKDVSTEQAHGFDFGQPTSAQILDLRVPGRVKGDSPFLAPLLPSMFVAVLGTYLWFQASIRLASYLPLAPILLGVTVGAIMRLGTKAVDFARVIFAVLITAFATFWGHAATKDFGPLGQLTADQILWSDLPRVANPVGLISTFHATAEISLARATLMFAGLLAAGLLASLTPK